MSMKKAIRFGWWVGLSLVLATCAKLEKEKLPVVTTAGPHAVEAGKTITVTAATTNGNDASYAWQSATPAVATVDAKTGVVTGVTAGATALPAHGGRPRAGR